MFRKITIGRKCVGIFSRYCEISGAKIGRFIAHIRDIYAFTHNQDNTLAIIKLSNCKNKTKKTVPIRVGTTFIPNYKNYSPITSTNVPLLPGTAPET